MKARIGPADFHKMVPEARAALCPLGRSALAWTDALTRAAGSRVPGEVHDLAKKAFSAKELAYLTAAVIAVNAWNRVAVAFRFLPSWA